MPLYRWSRMREEGYAWWVQRISRVLAYSNHFRIDHFRAFASYWSVPFDAASAADGRWEVGPGMEVFDALRAKLGELPVIAEDLAYVMSQDIHDLRDASGFPGMRVLMYGFYSDPSSDHIPHNFRRDVVAYTGTHDNDTVRGFWNTAPEHVRRFARAYLNCGDSDVHWAMIRAVLNSIADTTIFPLQDVLGLDENHRMNVVGTVGASNWSWRFTWGMVPPGQAQALARITAASGRCRFSLLGD
jgi:4-alpha-glucanotransferase